MSEDNMVAVLVIFAICMTAITITKIIVGGKKPKK
jgi:hypothetical protein